MMGTTSSITMQSLGKIAQCAPAVGAKIWCFFVGHAPSPLLTYLPCVRGVHCSNKHSVAAYCPISMQFAAFFHRWFVFQKHYIVLIFVARRRCNFHEIAVKNCEKSQNRRKSLCAPLRIDSWSIWKKFPTLIFLFPIQFYSLWWWLGAIYSPAFLPLSHSGSTKVCNSHAIALTPYVWLCELRHGYGLPFCQFSACYALSFSTLRVRHGTDRQTTAISA